MQNIWQQLQKDAPIVALAPMDGYCDSAFRCINKIVAPHIVVFSEFYSSDGLKHNPRLAGKVLPHYDEEIPLIFQIFGNDPETFVIAGKIIQSYGASGIDINMGCPAKKVVKCGYGSGLMIDRDNAYKIVNSLAESLDIPISVKTRLGWDGSEDLIDFGKGLENAGCSLLSVHARTFKQAFSGDADWTSLFDLKRALNIPVLGNGDVKNFDDGMRKIQEKYWANTVKGSKFEVRSNESILEKNHVLEPGSLNPQSGDQECKMKASSSMLQETNPEAGSFKLSSDIATEEVQLDGFMIGRAAIGNPWCFLPGGEKPDLSEILTIMQDHATRIVERKGEQRGCLEIRKHVVSYLSGFEGVKEYKKRLTQIESIDEARSVIEEIRMSI